MVKYEDTIYDYLKTFPFEILETIPETVKKVKFEYFKLGKVKRGKILFLNIEEELVNDLHIMGSEEEIRKIEEAYIRIFTHH